MVLYFNFDKPLETDWAVFGGSRGDFTFPYSGQSLNTYASYRDAIRSNLFQGSVNGLPRRLTDDQFAGSF